MTSTRLSWVASARIARRSILALGLLLPGRLAPGADTGLPAGGRFRWNSSAPLMAPTTHAGDVFYSVKDPSVVFHDGHWHLFVTVRGQKISHQIEYLRFKDWEKPTDLDRHFLQITNGYYCAPQVFYFTPQKKWYLLYQTSDTRRPVALQPAISTARDIADWRSWSAPRLLYDQHPANIRGWIDFWIICDANRAHLFFTSNNGLMWRAESSLEQFPGGWSEPVVALKDDIFEASHTYKLQGSGRYLTLVEAQGAGRRYYKAYLAERLDGIWTPLAATSAQPFAGSENVRFSGRRWADSISHGELLRAGVDEHLEIDPRHLRFVFQGALDAEMKGRKYGEIPWRLGLLQ